MSLILCTLLVWTPSSISQFVPGGPPRLIDGNIGYTEGFVTHGVNNFNGKAIVDLVSDGFGFIFQNAPYEQQVLNVDGDVAILPDETTDRNELLSTGQDFTIWFNELGIDVTPNPDVFNIPYLEIGTTTAASTSIDDRLKPNSFDEAPSNPSELYPNVYYPDATITVPNLGDWETASGLIEVVCSEEDDSAIITVTVCNMLPSSLYTVWEVGMTNPGPDETIYTHPAGGVGNVIRTNPNGYGKLVTKMPWCPLRECEPGISIDCQIYFSVFHHPDYIIYGGDFAGVSWKPFSYPAGVAGSNHLWFPLQGTYLQEPLNRFHKRQCKRKYKPLKKKNDHYY